MSKALIYATNVVICLAALTTKLGLAWHDCWGGYYTPVCEYNLSINNSITYDIKPSTTMCRLQIRQDEWDEQVLRDETYSVNIRCPGNATRILASILPKLPPRVQQLVLENCLIYWADLYRILFDSPAPKLILDNWMDEFFTGETECFYGNPDFFLFLYYVIDLHVSSSVVQPISKAFTTRKYTWADTTRASFSG